MPASNAGITTTVKLDNTLISFTPGGAFSFDVSTLAAGSHTISVKFVLGSISRVTDWPFTVTQPGVLNIDLSANIVDITSASQSVTVTGVNAGGGSNLRYTFAKDRAFTNILQAESSTNTVTINPATLNTGVNWIYGRISRNGQCYTTDTNIDSIQLNVNFVTGIVDVDAPGQVINVYPVPFRDYLLLKGLSAAKKYEVTLTNASGNRVFSGVVANRSSYEIRTEGLAAGVYLVHLTKNGKQLGVVMVVKQ
jgi:hypothetical protein